MLYNYYLKKLGYPNIPDFLKKYLNIPSLIRLKKVSYFCGMDYASKFIYNFKEPISRYDHSLSVSLLVYKLTKNKVATLAGLFHDIATPCFSHVIDYMNQDYEKQESTEEYTEEILKSDEYLISCLKKDNINIEDIIDFKKYPIVDNERPKLCADRLDGIILPGISWSQNVTKEYIDMIIDDIKLFINEDNEYEIGFKTNEIAKKVLEISDSINKLCHSPEDKYMMQLLADITNLSIEKGYITYNDLYLLDEEQLYHILKQQKDFNLNNLILKFENATKEDIPTINLKIKNKVLNPLVNNKRLN